MDIDDKSIAYDDTGFVSTVSESQSSEHRDEVQEIRNRSRVEDRRVDVWRWTLLFLILAIGVAITSLTYYFLQQEEDKALNLAVSELGSYLILLVTPSFLPLSFSIDAVRSVF